MVPREHGGWGILVFSLALGAGVAGSVTLPWLWLLLTALALFLARYPLTLAVRPIHRPRSQALFWGAVYLGGAVLAFLPLLFVYRLWWLSLFALALAGYLLADVYLAVSKKQRTAWGEMVSISGLAMAAPAAYYVSSAVWPAVILYLWLLSFLYHASSVYYVRLKVRHRSLPQFALSWARRWRLGRSLLLYLTVLLVAVLSLGVGGEIPQLAFLAYLPLMGKAIWGALFPSRVASIRVLGWTEVAHGLLFTGLLIAVYRLSG